VGSKRIDMATSILGLMSVWGKENRHQTSGSTKREIIFEGTYVGEGVERRDISPLVDQATFWTCARVRRSIGIVKTPRRGGAGGSCSLPNLGGLRRYGGGHVDPVSVRPQVFTNLFHAMGRGISPSPSGRHVSRFFVR
jgi:hypothetical protein